MAAKIKWHRHGTKLRHCHRMYLLDASANPAEKAEWIEMRLWGRAD